MAARKQLFHPDDVRQKIKASQLINRLTTHALSPKPLMDASQVRAAEALLRKSIPDLSAVTVQGGDNDKPIQHKVEVVFVAT